MLPSVHHEDVVDRDDVDVLDALGLERLILLEVARDLGVAVGRIPSGLDGNRIKRELKWRKTQMRGGRKQTGMIGSSPI